MSNELMQFKDVKGAQRMRDIDLARVLGITKPANIRQTIAKYLREKKLNDSDVVTQRVMTIVAQPTGVMGDDSSVPLRGPIRSDPLFSRQSVNSEQPQSCSVDRWRESSCECTRR